MECENVTMVVGKPAAASDPPEYPRRDGMQGDD